jgi:hypothetical protein
MPAPPLNGQSESIDEPEGSHDAGRTGPGLRRLEPFRRPDTTPSVSAAGPSPVNARCFPGATVIANPTRNRSRFTA